MPSPQSMHVPSSHLGRAGAASSPTSSVDCFASGLLLDVSVFSSAPDSAGFFALDPHAITINKNGNQKWRLLTTPLYTTLGRSLILREVAAEPMQSVFHGKAIRFLDWAHSCAVHGVMQCGSLERRERRGSPERQLADSITNENTAVLQHLFAGNFRRIRTAARELSNDAPNARRAPSDATGLGPFEEPKEPVSRKRVRGEDQRAEKRVEVYFRGGHGVTPADCSPPLRRSACS